MTDTKWRRRDFLRLSGQAAGVLAAGSAQSQPKPADAETVAPTSDVRGVSNTRAFNAPYEGDYLNRIAFPMGGIGAGMICLEGTGALSHVSIRNHPELYNEPFMFAAVSIKGEQPAARLLEGPVPARKISGLPYSGEGMVLHTYGLPRFGRALFTSRFPFATVALSDEQLPLRVEVTGWSPFIPGDGDNSSLPVLALEYRFHNQTSAPVEATFSFNSFNFLRMPGDAFEGRSIEGGFVISNLGSPGKEWRSASLAASVNNPDVKINNCWLRDNWPITSAWTDIEAGVSRNAASPSAEDSPGASLFVPLRLDPNGSATVVVRLAWYTPGSSLRIPVDPSSSTPPPDVETYRPWYAGRFSSVDQVVGYWRANYADLREKTLRFTDCFYDSTLPPEVMEAVSANLSILKSPTVLRQTDGKLWGWEGCQDETGRCEGSCTHVWNYAQAFAHLFPGLERTLRETEFGPSQSASGFQVYRSGLPIRPVVTKEPAAADGQLGGIMKVYRDWRISGDDAWLRALWPKVKLSLAYCIETWDPRHTGLLEEPHLNTYDIAFWGPDPMCTSIYLGALQAAIQMSRAMRETPALYEELLTKGKVRMESELFNGEYFEQITRVTGLNAALPTTREDGTPLPPDVLSLIEHEGPNWQIGAGCLSDGVLGVWLAAMCGIKHPLSTSKVESHLRAVLQYNLKEDLSAHANPMRSTFALGHDGGLLLCTWPRGRKPRMPMMYSTEVWTGIEYQVASHLVRVGMVDQGLKVVQTCRSRYDGRVRNPFAEYECGHWYARAMSSYALLEAFGGARFDAVDKVLYLSPAIKGDFRCFLSTATGYGTVGIKNGHPFVEVVSGTIPYRRIVFNGVQAT